MRKWFIVATVAALSVSGLAWSASRPARHHHRGAGRPARQPAAITWYSYEDARAISQRTGKATLVEFRAEWCSWCKKMEKEVYTQREVIGLGDRVVFARADEAQRKDLVKKYGVRGWPTVVLLDRNGREIKRIVGYKTAPAFVAEIRGAVGG